jgi:mRNA interferase RelE/StbE
MRVSLKPSDYKSLRKFPESQKTKFVSLIDQVALCKNTSEITNDGKLKGYSDRYKIRIGNYRIVYKTESENHITITAIAHRKDIYNRLFGFI